MPMFSTRSPRQTRPHRYAGDAASTPDATPPIFDEPALFYDPPYATEAEDTFAWHVVKYLKPNCGLRHNVEVTAGSLAITVDFVIEHNGHRIGVMCGASDASADHDRLRDALCMGTGAVDALYRFRASDLLDRPHDLLALVMQWDPALFSERGRLNIRALAHPVARDRHPRPTDTVVRLRYDDGTTAPLPSETALVQRLSQRHPDGWMPVYEQARDAFGLAHSPLRQRYAQSA
jgi:hypothetical protein